MKTLVINPSSQGAVFHLFGNGGSATPSLSFRMDQNELRAQAARNPKVHVGMKDPCSPAPDLIACRVQFGGDRFPRPVRFEPAIRAELKRLIPMAPIHIPLVLAIIDFCETVYPDVPMVLVFETAFFVDLPLREQFYAVPFDTSVDDKVRRFGFHGIYHESAAMHAEKELKGRGCPSGRLISICLEPCPELAAVGDRRPVMVTGGASPLDGIPGHTTCGGIDPSIPLILNGKLGWGPEKINHVLTRESGLLGLTGHPVTLCDVFTLDRFRPAREVIEYKLLQACGMAAAALGGVDALVFSGRFADLHPLIAPALTSALNPAGTRGQDIPICVLAKPLERLIADFAVALVA